MYPWQLVATRTLRQPAMDRRVNKTLMHVLDDITPELRVLQDQLKNKNLVLSMDDLPAGYY